ncbi:MAG TPA: type II toxin-antitoxin system HipA family toxin [Solirubrobacterales bacterium]|nr:type II toxin-antitoxin system HipA family toxin [Solirubrobacterales bacterium]
MEGSRERVRVLLDAADLGPPRTVGALTRARGGGQSVISFEYDAGWVGARDSFPLDPGLQLFEGEQFPAALPGVFADAAPDRWGRTLQERREGRIAREQGRLPRPLDDWDFLVGVSDPLRMGALRLAREDGTFIDDHDLTVPPSTRLRELEHWARQAEEGQPQPGSEQERWVAMLVAPGSSLGGARPKATFRDEDDTLWIAKFPSREDRHDVGAWEYLVARIAADAGIEIPEVKLLELGAGFRTFSSQRFDRAQGGRRLYASAMTLTGRRDGEAASYLDIAEAIVREGDPGAIEQDLRQLFRRLVFNVLVGNRDDHLRNHGFLRTPGGWRLAPAFDVNPAPFTVAHSLALDEAQTAPDLGAALATAELYRLGSEEAGGIAAEVEDAVARWRPAARELGLTADEVELFAPAFAS